MKDFDDLRVSLDAEKNGVWVTHPKLGEFLIARAGNPDHERAKEEVLEPYKALLSVGGTIPPDEDWAITARALAVGVLKGWKGPQTPYSVDEAEKILADRELRDFRNWVIGQSVLADRFQKATIAAQEKNSSSASATKSGGARK